jgi:hypothetical protein
MCDAVLGMAFRDGTPDWEDPYAPAAEVLALLGGWKAFFAADPPTALAAFKETAWEDDPVAAWLIGVLGLVKPDASVGAKS